VKHKRAYNTVSGFFQWANMGESANRRGGALREGEVMKGNLGGRFSSPNTRKSIAGMQSRHAHGSRGGLEEIDAGCLQVDRSSSQHPTKQPHIFSSLLSSRYYGPQPGSELAVVAWKEGNVVKMRLRERGKKKEEKGEEGEKRGEERGRKRKGKRREKRERPNSFGLKDQVHPRTKSQTKKIEKKTGTKE